MIKETYNNTEVCDCGRRLEMKEYKDGSKGYHCRKCDIKWVKKEKDVKE